MTERELKQRARAWADALNLHDWAINTKFYLPGECPEHIHARVWRSENHRRANMFFRPLNEPIATNELITLPELENSIAHEVLHVLFWWYNPPEDSVEFHLQEQAINTLATVLCELAQQSPTTDHITRLIRLYRPISSPYVQKGANQMDRAFLLMIARALGLDISRIKSLATTAIAAEIKSVVDHKMHASIPAVTKHLVEHDKLDPHAAGTVQDKDGVTMTHPQFFVHEAQYNLWRRGVSFPGELADYIRDRHEGRIWSVVSPQITDASTPEEVVTMVYNAEMDQTF